MYNQKGHIVPPNISHMLSFDHLEYCCPTLLFRPLLSTTDSLVNFWCKTHLVNPSNHKLPYHIMFMKDGHIPIEEYKKVFHNLKRTYELITMEHINAMNWMEKSIYKYK